MAELSREASDKLLADARTLMPGGVSSPVRAFAAVGGDPVFVARGEGASIVDADGNEYIDLVQSWGALLFGHARAEVVAAVQDTAARGTTFGGPTELEVELARLVSAMVPGAERVRFVSSGTEAAATAIRLARGVTGRSKVVKFAGCYHGHVDALLVEAGSGVATRGEPGTSGVTDGAAADTIVCPYNDFEAVSEAAARFGDDLAAVIVEPVAANMGLVLPHDGWLDHLRALTAGSGALLVFDEVITGFRLGPGGATERYGIVPDLLLLGKILGGGMPAAAVAGRGDVLDHLAPVGPVYQAGTLAGNPVAMAAGIATLSLIRSDGTLYERLQERARDLVRAFVDAADAAEVPLFGAAIGGLAGIFFSGEEVVDYDSARASDGDAYARFFRAMLARGVYLPPSRFEALFLSDALTADHVEKVAAAAGEALVAV